MSPERWRDALRRLGQASRLNPWNADYAAELGRHYAWLAWREQGSPDRSAVYRKASADSYRTAIRLRPTWGFAWINFAESRMLAGQNDQETHRALQRAMDLAPLEPDTQLKVLLVGFSLWDTLPEATRDEVRATLRRAILLNNRVDQIIRLAFQTNRTAELTGMLKQPRHLDLYDRIKTQAKN